MTKRKKAHAPELSFAQKEVKKIDDIFTKYARFTGFNTMSDYSLYNQKSWAVDRLIWLDKFHKIPKEIFEALEVKILTIFDGEYYGDEPFETTIENFIKGV